MTYSNLLNAKNRDEFRLWLENNHSTETECWLVVKRASEATFFGMLTRLKKRCVSARLTARRKNSTTELQFNALRRAVKTANGLNLTKNAVAEWNAWGCMTGSGREVLTDMSDDGFVIDKDILAALQSDVDVWTNFQNFPSLYKRVRIDTIQIKKNQPDVFAARLNKFIENTKKGVVYGEWNDNGRLL